MAKETYNGKKGVWRTINGAHVFIEDGKTAEQALESLTDYAKNTKKQMDKHEEKGAIVKPSTAIKETVKSAKENVEDKYREANTDNKNYQPVKFAEEVRRKLTTEKNPNKIKRYKEYLLDIKNEPKTSKTMQGIADEIGTELIGFDFRLKDSTKNRFEEKINEVLDKRSGDNIRYTIALDDGVTYYHKMVRELKVAGYVPVEVKNYWKKNIYYKGINTKWESPSGSVFEVQFHSKHNATVKEELHPWYEIRRDIQKKDQWEEADKNQEEISKKFIKPNGIEEI